MSRRMKNGGAVYARLNLLATPKVREVVLRSLSKTCLRDLVAYCAEHTAFADAGDEMLGLALCEAARRYLSKKDKRIL